MLWTPGCPQITCWQAIPLARVKGGFNCDGVSIGQAYTKALYRKNQNRNTKQSLHHSPIHSPSQQQVFSFCLPLASVNSRSTNPPIVNFLPTPNAKKKAKHPVQSSLNANCWISVNFSRYFCKPHQLNHLLVIISNNTIISSSGP